MEIRFSNKYKRQYRKLTADQRAATEQAFLRFHENPFDPRLQNHALHGKYEGERAISAGYDLRIVFREQGGYTVVVALRVGTHDDVY